MLISLARFLYKGRHFFKRRNKKKGTCDCLVLLPVTSIWTVGCAGDSQRRSRSHGSSCEVSVGGLSRPLFLTLHTRMVAEREVILLSAVLLRVVDKVMHGLLAMVVKHRVSGCRHQSSTESLLFSMLCIQAMKA